MDGNVSEEYTASVFRSEIILYFLPTRVHHHAKPSKMAQAAMLLVPIREVFQVRILVWT